LQVLENHSFLPQKQRYQFNITEVFPQCGDGFLVLAIENDLRYGSSHPKWEQIVSLKSAASQNSLQKKIFEMRLSSQHTLYLINSIQLKLSNTAREQENKGI